MHVSYFSSTLTFLQSGIAIKSCKKNLLQLSWGRVRLIFNTILCKFPLRKPTSLLSCLMLNLFPFLSNAHLLKNSQTWIKIHPLYFFRRLCEKPLFGGRAFAALGYCGRRCVCRWAFRLKNAHYLMCLTRPLGFVWYLKHTARSAGFHSSIILFLFF